MKDSIQKFVLRTLLAALPVFLFIAFYASVDPFHVIDPVTPDGHGRDSVIVGANAGFTSIETYLHYNDQYRYDSFIFGSSMSQNYKASYWKPYVGDSASILHFDASNETLAGIINKMRFLNNHGSTIKNALIVIEVMMLDRQPCEDDILFVQHPRATWALNWVKVNGLFLNAFRDLNQVKRALMPSLCEKQVQNEGIISGVAPPGRIGHLNEMYYAEFDSIIAHNPDEYYTPERLKRIRRIVLPSVTPPAIDEDVEAQLRTIKDILNRNHTHYMIIVPPCGTNPRLTWHDLWMMRSIFGEERVHDYSGVPELVNNERVYYDHAAHLISAKCKMLLDSAYHDMATRGIKNPYYR